MLAWILYQQPGRGDERSFQLKLQHTLGDGRKWTFADVCSYRYPTEPNLEILSLSRLRITASAYKINIAFTKKQKTLFGIKFAKAT